MTEWYILSMTGTPIRHFFTYLPGLLLGLWVLFPSNAEIPYTPHRGDPVLESWRWRTFPELQGKGLSCLGCSPDGVMWFGTNNGIWRYNGLNWKHYTQTDGVYGERIYDLEADQTGRMFAATDRGLVVFESGRWLRVFPQTEESKWRIWSLFIEQDGTIWLGSDEGLIVLRPEKPLVFITTPEHTSKIAPIAPDAVVIEVPKNSKQPSYFTVHDVLVSKEGKTWVGIGNGTLVCFRLTELLQQDTPEWQVYDNTDGLLIGPDPVLLETRDGDIWSVSWGLDGGLNVYRNGRWESTRLSQQGGSDINADLMQTRDGTVWVGGFALHAWRNGSWTIYDTVDLPLPSQRILLQEAPDGAIWLGGYTQEAVRLDYATPRWKTYVDLNYQCEHPEGVHWFITKDNQVIRQEGDQWFQITDNDNIIDTPVALYATSRGDIWAIGSHRHTAAWSRFDGTTWTRYTAPGLSWGIDGRAFYEDQNGHIWLGATVDRVRQQDQKGGLLEIFPNDAGIPIEASPFHHFGEKIPNFVYGIAQIPDGRLFFGSGDLNVYHNKEWKDAEGPDQAVYNYCDVVYSDSEGILWVGTRDHGVFSYDGKQWVQHGVQHGLSNNAILSILKTTDGTVWVATNRGVSRYDGQTWTTHALPAELRVGLRRGNLCQSSDGGLWINRTSRAWHRQAYINSSSREIGLDDFWTIRYQSEQELPEVYITTQVDQVPNHGTVHVYWKGIDAWQATPPQGLEYSYRLNGSSWSQFSRATDRVFFNLPEGMYTFEVRCRDRDYNLSSSPAVLSFHVLPPVWKTPWFLSLLVAMVGLIAIQTTRVLSRDRFLRQANQSLSELNQSLEQEVRKHDVARSLLRSSEEKYRSLINNLPVISWTCSQAGEFRFLSPNCPRLLGYPDSFTGTLFTSWQEALNGEDYPRFHKALNDLFENGNQLEVVCRIKNSSQEWRFYEISSVSTYWVEDELLADGIMEDVTVRTETEQALAIARERIRSFVESVDDLVYYQDINGAITPLNHMLSKTTGIASHQIESDPDIWRTFIHPEDVAAFETVFLYCPKETNRFEMEYRIKNYQGEWLWYHTQRTPVFGKNGAIIGFNCIDRDVTENVAEQERRLELETQIQQTQKLESLGVLAGGVAHDFNNLLVGILGNASHLADQFANDPETLSIIQQIESASQRAADLTRQMLAYSGGGQFVIETIYLDQVIMQMQDFLKASVARRVELEMNFGVDLPPIAADATQIRQVVLNLVTNASEATSEEGGSIRLQTGLVQFGAEFRSQFHQHYISPAGTYVFLEVIDQGKGIASADLPRIFDPFFTTKFTGRGLGLSAVLGIVRGLHGDIQVDSVPEGGTTFRILLPALDNQGPVKNTTQPEISGRQQPQPAVVEKPVEGANKILVIDDEEIVLDVGSRILEKMGYAPLVADNGQEGIDLVRDHARTIIMVILDLTMPDLDGIEVFRSIQSISPNIPVILSSGYGEEEATRGFEGKALAGFLQKPYRADDLRSIIRSVLET